MKRMSAAAALAAISLLCLHALASAQPGPQQPDLNIDAATRKQVIDNALKRLNDGYVFADVAQAMEKAVRDRAAKGEYDQITSARAFAEKLTNDLQAVSKDKHLRVRYSHQPIPERQGGPREPTAEEREQHRREMAWMNSGFSKVERLPGNIGYIEFRGFTDPEAGADTVAAAMNFVANTDALIIDLRRNGGGRPDMVALISSYLFGPDPVHLNSLYWREGDRTEEFWTRKEVAGKRYLGKDVYVLTSNRTFSGAEEFSYNLKSLKRATIVGETTGGGAHPGGMARLHEHFGMFIPRGRAINPLTKTNWEGTGVKPDVEVPADQALHVARLAALKKQHANIKDADLKADVQFEIDRVEKELADLKAKAETAKSK
ncbi:MAG TPA: S41 family peptidase [Pyrinomonadaceae bacterium]|nr:S41 family peptidase [Pyrinomonadaceae bacterium]